MAPGSLIAAVFDLIILVMLVCSIGFCLVLNRRLKVIRDSQSDFAKYVQTFDSSIDRAERTLNDLTRLSVEVIPDLLDNAKKAETLLPEIRTVMESGNRVADRIEESIGQNKLIVSQLLEEADRFSVRLATEREAVSLEKVMETTPLYHEPVAAAPVMERVEESYAPMQAEPVALSSDNDEIPIASRLSAEREFFSSFRFRKT